MLATRYGVHHISTGELLRSEMAKGTDIGRQASVYVRAGELVPDALVLDLLTDTLRQASEEGGWILDGFPRSLRQAEEAYRQAAMTGATADAVVYLAVPDEIVRERIAARASEGRADDTDPSVTERRLGVFHSETEPLLDYYENRGVLVRVPASGTPEEVAEAMIAEIERRQAS